MMDTDTLGCSGQRGSWGLRELASGDYPTFDALIWCGELTCLTFLFLTSFETMLFELRARD